MLLEEYVAEHGKKWKLFEEFFPGRTEISIKNRYNVLLRRRARDIKVAMGLPLKSKKEHNDPISEQEASLEPTHLLNSENEFGIADNQDWMTWWF
jgi:hypothetical protein